MIKAIIFDFYGVIYSNFDWDVIDERIQKDPEKAMKFREYAQRANTGRLTNDAFMQKVSVLAEDSSYPQKPAVKADPSMNYPVLGIIDRLNETYKFGLLSNGGEQHIDRVFSGVGGVTKFFDSVITSSDTKHIKPSKKAFMDMIISLDVEPNEALMVDDSSKHIEGAKKTGLNVIRYENMVQLRGDFEKLGIL